MANSDLDKRVIRLTHPSSSECGVRQSADFSGAPAQPDIAPPGLDMYDPELTLRRAVLSRQFGEACDPSVARELFLVWAMSLDTNIDPALAASVLTRCYADALRHWPTLDHLLRQAARFPRGRLARVSRRRRSRRRTSG